MSATVAVSRDRDALAANFELSRPEELPEPQKIYAEIAQRAYELFQARDCRPGNDWEDWFRAEAEILRPVPVDIKEEPDKISVRATVLGFDAAELKASVEPWRVIIVGKKQPSLQVGEKIFYVDWTPCEIFRVVYLPKEVIPELATAKLHAGVLELTLPRTRGAQPARYKGR